MRSNLAMFAGKRGDAITYLSQSSRAYTDDQLKYEAVCRWNGGSYHTLGDKAKAWVRNPNMVCAPGTGNMGWDMTDLENKGKTLPICRNAIAACLTNHPRRERTGNIRVSVMRMPYWVSALAVSAWFGGAPAAAPQGQLALPSGGSIAYSAAGSKTRFDIQTKSGRRYEVNVERDSMVSPKAQPATAKLVGEVADKALILTDTYPSVPLGLGYCQAGEERFLRV